MTPQRPFRRAAGRLFAGPPDDTERHEFIARLDAAPFNVTDWEAGFIETCMDWEGDFTPRQRDAIDRLMEKYAHQL